MPRDTAAMTVAPNERVKNKPLPPGIDPNNPPVVYWAPECSGTRLIAPESEKWIAPEIEYLRQFKAGVTRPLVTGRVSQDGGFGMSSGFPGVKVTIAGADFRGSAQTDDDGRYSFADIPPGRYTLNPILAAYTPWGGAIQVHVNRSGCSWVNFKMAGSGVIEGQLFDREGRPAPHVKVNILRVGADGKPVMWRAEDAESDSEGRYQFEKLPSADFQIGVNISSAPDAETPYPATAWSENGQSTVHLNAGEHRQLAPFKLPAGAAVRRVSVRVLWPDGRPAKGVNVFAEVVGERFGGVVDGKTDTAGRTRLDLLEGTDYSVEGLIWVGTGEHAKRADSAVIRIKPGSDPIRLNLRLNEPTKIERKVPKRLTNSEHVDPDPAPIGR